MYFNHPSALLPITLCAFVLRTLRASWVGMAGGVMGRMLLRSPRQPDTQLALPASLVKAGCFPS